MNKEQEDYIKLEEAAKEWINKTDDSQFETYELLAMFASGEIKKLFSLPVVIDCSTCKHRGVSNYIEPCYGCRDNDGYDNYESAIGL